MQNIYIYICNTLACNVLLLMRSNISAHTIINAQNLEIDDHKSLSHTHTHTHSHSLSLSLSLSHTHTHTDTHNTFMCVCVCVCV